MGKLVSKTYGDALFNAALEENVLETVNDEITLIEQTLNENRDFEKLLNHPKISVEEKVAVTESVLKGRFSDTTVGFFVLLVNKGRIGEVHEILSYFTAKVKEYKNIGVAYVTSAVSLTEEQKDAVRQKLLTVTKYDEFELFFKEDASLIGGMVIRIGDRVVDSSIRTKLDKMSKELSNIQLA